MTKEEAKKMGATHYRAYTGQYLKVIGTYWYILRNNKWYSIPHYPFNIKPL